MKIVALVATIVAGVALPLQSLVNAKLAGAVGGALLASLATFLIGSIALTIIVLLTRANLPSLGVLTPLPWWMWTGGLLGVLFVVVTTLTVPILGATALLVFLLLGQMGGAIVMDHFAVLADVARPITWQSCAGIALVLVGAGLVVKG